MLSVYPQPVPPHVVPSLLSPPLTPRNLNSSTPDFELVIAHYNEDLDWLDDFAPYSTIYSKGDAVKGNYRAVYPLRNIGRETHTYLTHVVKNYDRLAQVTLFLQGNIHDINNGTPAHTDMSVAELVGTASQFEDGQVMPIGKKFEFHDWDGINYKPGWVERRGKGLEHSKLTPGQFWEHIYSSPHPKSIQFVQGALFGVTRAAIHRRPRSFYENLLRYFEDLNSRNPEEGHYMERFWYSIFTDDAIVEP